MKIISSNKKLLFSLLLSLVCFFLPLVFVAFLKINLLHRYIITFLINFLVSLWFYLNVDKSVKYFLIFFLPALFSSFVSFHSTYLGNSYILPLGIVDILSMLAAYKTSFIEHRRRVYKILSFFIILSSYAYGSWLYGWNEDIFNSNAYNEIKIETTNKTPIDLKEKKGKVLVLDLWSSSCGVCFKKFPEFEKQYLKYKNDDKVEFYSLNLPLKGDEEIDIEKFTKQYSFPNLYAKSINSWQHLNVSGVPLLVILDKKGKVRFKGDMNTNKYFPYNNLNRLIEKFKNE